MRLGNLISIVGGGTPSKEVSEYWNGCIPWATVKDLKNNYLFKTQDSISQTGLDNSSSKVVKSGGLIIATRMAVGKVVIPQIDVAINQDLKGITCKDELDSKFLYYFFKSKENFFNSLATGATVKGIKINHIADIKIPLLPLPVQQKIAAILDVADALKQKDKALIVKYDELTKSLFLDMFGDPVTNPMAWKMEKLGLSCTVIRGSSPRPKGDPRYYGGTVPRLMVADVTRDGMYVTPKIDFLTEEGSKKSRPMKKGDMVMAVSGKPGIPAILNTDCCIHDGFAGFKNFNENYNFVFLYYYFINYVEQVSSRSVGAIFKNITTDDIRKIGTGSV